MLELFKKPIGIDRYFFILVNIVQTIVTGIIVFIYIEPDILQIILSLQIEYQLCKIDRRRADTLIILKEHF